MSPEADIKNAISIASSLNAKLLKKTLKLPLGTFKVYKLKVKLSFKELETLTVSLTQKENK